MTIKITFVETKTKFKIEKNKTKNMRFEKVFTHLLSYFHLIFDVVFLHLSLQLKWYQMFAELYPIHLEVLVLVVLLLIHDRIDLHRKYLHDDFLIQLDKAHQVRVMSYHIGP